MLAPSEELRTFEAMKDDLLRAAPGQFAVVAGRKLIGVFQEVDEALVAASRAFDADLIPAGAAILISEIAERSTLRVMATPYPRSEARAAGAS